MLFLGGIIFIFLVGTIAVFAFPVLSPIPYYPSNRKDLKKILGALNLKNDETLVDLGAGDGIVIFEAARQTRAKNFNTEFVADEVNPILFLILMIRRFFHPNKKSIHIVLKDMFKLHTSPLPTEKPVFYLYVSPWFLERIHTYLKHHFANLRIITYFYPLPHTKPKKIIQGIHKIFVY